MLNWPWLSTRWGWCSNEERISAHSRMRIFKRFCQLNFMATVCYSLFSIIFFLIRSSRCIVPWWLVVQFCPNLIHLKLFHIYLIEILVASLQQTIQCTHNLYLLSVLSCVRKPFWDTWQMQFLQVSLLYLPSLFEFFTFTFRGNFDSINADTENAVLKTISEIRHGSGCDRVPTFKEGFYIPKNYPPRFIQKEGEKMREVYICTTDFAKPTVLLFIFCFTFFDFGGKKTR